MSLPPIKLQRLYDKMGNFIIRAEPLTADVARRMTDAEHMARQDAENKAIDAAWEQVRAQESLTPREVVDRDELARRYPKP